MTNTTRSATGFVSLYRTELARHSKSHTFGHAGAIFVVTGKVRVDGETLRQGEGAFVHGTRVDLADADVPSKLLHFEITQDAPASKCAPLLSEAFVIESHDVLVRLDTVSFPPSARAYRHTHPGPGIRYLTEGALEIKSDHETAIMHVSDAWFEDADSPVQATAQDVPATTFVRLLILPVAFEGKPTFTYLNEEDRAKPRLQTNVRFFDQRWRIEG